jgi:hypothetical protein
MSSRIKELETALAEAQAQGSKSQHPLLAAGVKWEEPDEPNLPPESDTESLAGPPYDDKYDEKHHQDDTDDLDEPAHGEEMSAMDMHHLGLPHEIIQLATAFPLGVSGRPNLQMLFFQFIPRRERATELGKIYYQCSSWMWVNLAFLLCFLLLRPSSSLVPLVTLNSMRYTRLLCAG